MPDTATAPQGFVEPEPLWLGRAGFGARRALLPLTSFVGRESEIGEVERILGTTRLLTLTGTGGVGKTRLALEVGNRALAAGGHVWLAEFAPLASPDLVPRAVAAALGVIEQPGRPLVDMLIGRLRRIGGLLVLDNCEHVLGSSATLVEVLLADCPDLRVLATSRRPLRIAGEVTWLVPSLSLPARSDRRGTTSGHVLAMARASEAVRLFADRATMSLPGFAVGQDNVQAVMDVCERLDGIPLAIELAAARARVLTPHQISQRLMDRFGLLARGSLQAESRQQTLRNSVAWSYDLISEEAQTLLRQVSVFVGGWTLEAAEAICGQAILDPLSELVEASLVLADPLSDRVARYGLLETIRAYAAERLREAGEQDTLRRRHRDWFLAVAESAELHYWGPGQVEVYEQLESELDNLRAALDWTVAQQDGEIAVRLGAALWRFWDVRGHFGEARERVASILSLPGADAPSVPRAKALTQLAYMTSLQGDHAVATELLEESHSLSEQLSFDLGCALALVGHGIIAASQGELERAEGLLAQAVARSHACGEVIGKSVALFWLGEMARGRGAYEQAIQHLEQAVTLNETLGDVCGRAFVLTSLGQSLAVSGDQRRALALQQESLTLRRLLGARWGIAQCLQGLAGFAAAQRQWEQAARLLGAAVGVRAAIGATAWPPEAAEAERIASAVRDGLGDERFEAAWASGRDLDVDTAIDLGLQPVSPPKTARRTSAASGDAASILTRREREIVGLIAQGLTNRQIAEELVISELTAETHVRNILARLGFANRAQIAAWAATQGFPATGPA